jgi:hypothetical protein
LEVKRKMSFLYAGFCQGVIVAARGVKPQYPIRFAADAGENVRYAAL